MKNALMEPWTELRTALILARTETVSGAASALGVHRATVIRHVDILEEYLGARLFLRHAKGYALTENGQEMIAAADRMEAQFYDFAGRVRGRAEMVSGELVVTAVSAVSAHIMPSIAAFRKTYPAAIVRFQASTDLVELGYGEAHVAIRAGARPSNPDYVVLPFMAIRVGLYATAEYCHAHRDSIAQGRWQDLQYVAMQNVPVGSVITDWMARNVPAENYAFISNDSQPNMHAIVAGVGAGWIAEPEARQRPELREIIPPQVAFKDPLWFVTHMDMHRTAKVQAFKAILMG